MLLLGWYAAEVHNHRLGAQQLEKQGLTVFDPIVRTTRIDRGRARTTERAYIPGYLFIQFDMDGQAWRFINSTFGIKRLISAGEEPIRIRDDSMEILLDRCVGGYVEDAATLDIELERVGKDDEVHVLDGPFANFPAVATRKQLGDKVWVSLMIFGRQTAAMLPRKSVEIARRALGPSI